MNNTITDTVFTRVFGTDMTPALWTLLDSARESVHNGLTLNTLLECANLSKIQVWHWRGTHGEGIMLTEILQHEHKRNLNIVGLAGEGYLASLKTIYATLSQYCLQEGCDNIVGTLTDPRLAYAYRKILGAKKIHETWGIPVGSC